VHVDAIDQSVKSITNLFGQRLNDEMGHNSQDNRVITDNNTNNIIVITEYLVPHLQRAEPKRHHSVTKVYEELKAIFKK